MNNNMAQIDIPIEDEKDDILGRAPFAQKAAESIINNNASNSFTYGIQGEWGTGKTSFANLVIKSIEESDKNNKFIIERYDPWYFTGEHQILVQLCNTLIRAVKDKKTKANEVVESFSGIMRNISRAIKPFSGAAGLIGTTIGAPWIGLVPNAVERVSQFAKDLSDSFEDDSNIVELKERANDILNKIDKKIIIVIDDIDRLSYNETIEVFRAVKNITNFTNTRYILLYGKEYIKKALKNEFDENYTEKIINHEIDIPSPPQGGILKFFQKEIDKTFGEISDSEGEYYHSYSLQSQEEALKNLRNAKRIINRLSLSYQSIKDETNPIDLLFLTILREQAAEVYDFIYKNGISFLENEAFQTNDNIQKKKEKYNEFKKGYIQNKNTDWPFSITERLFPPFLIGKPDSKNHERFITNKRLCTKEYFFRYFALIKPENEISELEFNKFIDNSESYDRLIEIIEENQKEKKAFQLIKGLRFKISEIIKREDKHISNIIAAILDNADSIKGEGEEYEFGASKSKACDQSYGLAINLLDEIPTFTFENKDNTERKENIFKEAINTTRSATNIISQFFEYLGIENGNIEPIGGIHPKPKELQYIRNETYQAALKTLKDRLDNTKTVDLLERNGFIEMVWYLRNLGLDNISERIINDILSYDCNYCILAKIFAQSSYNSVKGKTDYISLEGIAHFIKEPEISNDEIFKRIDDSMNQCEDEALKGFIAPLLTEEAKKHASWIRERSPK